MSRHPEGGHDAVAGRDDGRHVPLVLGDQPVVLQDGLGRPVLPLVRGELLAGDPAGPQHVVAQVQSAHPDPLASGPTGIRIPDLVDVVVDNVELAVRRLERRDGLAHVPSDRFGQTGPSEVVEALLLVLRVPVGAVDLAARTDGPAEPVGRVAVPGAEFEDPPGSDGPGQQLHRDPHEPADDREAALLPLSLHLEQHGLVVAREEPAHVLLDLRVHDVHASASDLRDVTRPGHSFTASSRTLDGREVSMTRRVLIPLAALLLVMAVSPISLASPANTRVTRDATPGSYLRYDGTSDATMAACSTGRRSQNEPTIAVDPHNTQVVVAGSNDYCAAIVNGDVWPGYYLSTDGGGIWNDSLVPGSPDDSSAAGLASPAHGSCGAAGDPSQAFDADGRLFYAFICFTRSKPINGAVYSARYLSDGSAYDRTVLIKKGSPSAQFSGSGLFQDKINVAADQTPGPFSGNVYVAWSQYTGKAPNNSILLSRSTDHGLTFSPAIRVTPVEKGTGSFTDLAVGPDGAVYLTYLTSQSSSRPTADVWLLQSLDG